MADISGSSPSTRKIQVALPRYSPAIVRVERADGDPTKIKPTGKRGRWQRVLEAFPSDGTRVEFLDKSGAVLWSRDIDDDDEKPATKRVAEADQLFQLVQTANDVAQRRAQEFVETMHKSFHSVITMLTERLSHLERNYSAVLQLAADSAAKPVGEQTETEQQNAELVNVVLKTAVEKGIDKAFPPKGNTNGQIPKKTT
jgi:hypothetical protein